MAHGLTRLGCSKRSNIFIARLIICTNKRIANITGGEEMAKSVYEVVYILRVTRDQDS